MFTGTVVQIAAGQSMPLQAIQKCLEKHTSCIGVAVSTEGEVTCSSFRTSDVDTDDLGAQLDQFKDNHRVLFFGSYPENFSIEDVPPFSLIEDGANPILTAILVGDWSRASGDENHPGQSQFYAAVHGEGGLRERMQEAYEDCQNDLAVLLNKLDKRASFQQDLLGLCADHGLLVLIDNTGGEPWSIAKGVDTSTFSWGWMSDNCGYGEAEFPEKQEETPVEEPKKPAISLAPKAPSAPRAASAAPKAPTADSPPRVPEAKPEPKGSVPEVKLPDNPAVAAYMADKAYAAKVAQSAELNGGEPKFIEMEVPMNWNTKNRKKAFIERMGFLPPGWDQEGMKFPQPLTKPLKEFKEIAAVVGGVKPTDTAIPSAVKNSGTAPKAPGKPQTFVPRSAPKAPAQVADTKPVEPEKQSIPDDMPVLTAQDKQQLMTQFIKSAEIQKLLDQSSMEVLNPRSLQNMEKKYPSFAEDMGLDGLEKTFNWPFAKLFELCTLWPKAAAILLADYRLAYLKTLAAEEKAQVTTPTENAPPAATSANASKPKLLAPRAPRKAA